MRQSHIISFGKVLLWQLQKFLRAHWIIFIVNKQTDTLIYNLYKRATSESGQFYRKKQIEVSFSCVCPVIDNDTVTLQCYGEIYDQ